MINDEKALTIEQFNEIMKEINGSHSFGRAKHTNWVKYVRPSFDMRDGKCFYIKLDYQDFDSRECESTMFEEIMLWLKRERSFE